MASEPQELGTKPLEGLARQGTDARHSQVDKVLWTVRRRGLLSYEEDFAGLLDVGTVYESFDYVRPDRAHGCGMGASGRVRGAQPTASASRADWVTHSS